MTLKTSEWAQYSDVLGRQYNAFQLGWFPDYVDVENYVVPFYRLGYVPGERVQEREDRKPDQGSAGDEERIRTIRHLSPDPDARRAGRLDHSVLAGKHDRSRSAEHHGHSRNASMRRSS